MAASRHSDLPTLRITAEQLTERTQTILDRKSSRTSTKVQVYRDPSPLHTNKYEASEDTTHTPTGETNTQIGDDNEFQIKPTKPGPLLNSVSSPPVDFPRADEVQRSISKPGRGRGYRRTRGKQTPPSNIPTDIEPSRATVESTSPHTTHQTGSQSKQAAISLRGRSRGQSGRRGSGTRGTPESCSSTSGEEDLVSVWKSLCNGKIERGLSSWCETGSHVTFQQILHTVEKLQTTSEKLLLTQLETSCKIDVCSKLWKLGPYAVIESLRKMTSTGNGSTEELIKFLKSTEEFYSSLLRGLQTSYGFDLTELVNGRMELTSKKKLRVVMLAVFVCHQCYISLGDISRYGQQLTDKPNWGKPRIFYLKAQEMAPKDGRPYNQLAIIALNAHRRLDAFYFYMRSLMVKNSFKSAHDSLVGLFEDTSTKAKKQEEQEKKVREKAERKSLQKQKREEKQRNKHHKQHKDRRSESSLSGRREVWMMPGFEKEGPVDMTVGVASGKEQEKVDNLTYPEVFKKLVSAFLVAHGKLFTKIGIETFSSSLTLMSDLWSSLLSSGLTTTDAPQLVKIMVINIFSIHHAADNHNDNLSGQQFYCSLGLTLALTLTTTLLRTCLDSLRDNQMTLTDTPPQGIVSPIEECEDTSVLMDTLSLDETDVKSTKSCDPPVRSKVEPSDAPMRSKVNSVLVSDYTSYLLSSLDCLSVLLPAVRVWLQWVCEQRELWRGWVDGVDKTVMAEFWSETCLFLNTSGVYFPGLTKLIDTTVLGDGQQCRLWEDRMLAGFLPLGATLSTQDTLAIQDVTSLSTDQLRDQSMSRIADIARMCAHLSTLTDYGLTFDPTLGKFDITKLVSDLIKGTIRDASEPDAKSLTDEEVSLSSDDDVVVEGYSSEEEVEGGEKKEEEAESSGTPSEIEQLKAHREMLTKRMEAHSHALESAKCLLDEATKLSEVVVKITPRYLIPDTNCFVDMLTSIRRLVETTYFIIALPLVVLTELEGLCKGSLEKDVGKEEKKNTAKVAAGAKSAVEFVDEMFSNKSPHVRALTTQGTLLSSLSFRDEVTNKASNDDLILESCQQLHSGVDKEDAHSVVLITDDRNLRVKAHATNLPVKDMPSFVKLLTE